MFPPFHLLGPVLLLGFFHGLSPEHGWPLAVVYALRSRHRIFVGIFAGTLLGIGHLLSSIAVVFAFLFLGRFFTPSSQILKLVAGILLILLGLRELVRSHRHTHSPGQYDHTHRGKDDLHGPEHGSQVPNMEKLKEKGFFSLLGFAVLLGFAHEEEFQILGFCAGEPRFCLILMSTYAFAVLTTLVVTTALVLSTTKIVTHPNFERYLPWITSFLLIATGIRFLLH